MCKACSYKKKKSDDGYVPAEWRDFNGKEYQASSNFVPTFYGPVMISKKHVDLNASPEERIIQPMMWGMIPPWHQVRMMLEAKPF